MVTKDNINDSKKQSSSVVDLTTYDAYAKSPEARLINDIHGQPLYQAIQTIIHASGLSYTQISKLTLIGEKTLQRMSSPSYKHRLRMQTIVALCLGLRLDFAVSIELLACNGTTLLPPRDNIYIYLIRTSFSRDIYEANQILLDHGYPHLTRNRE